MHPAAVALDTGQDLYVLGSLDAGDILPAQGLRIVLLHQCFTHVGVIEVVLLRRHAEDMEGGVL